MQRPRVVAGSDIRTIFFGDAKYARHLDRLLLSLPLIAGLVGGIAVTVAAWWTGLPEPGWDLLVGLGLALVAMAAIRLATALSPPLLRRLPFPPLTVLLVLSVLLIAVVNTIFWPLIGRFLDGRSLWHWFVIWYLPMGWLTLPLSMLAVVGYESMNLRLQSSFVELDRRRGLERFLPEAAVDRVLAGEDLALAGERRTVTILFADLRDSTAIAERLEPEAVVELLNLYVGAMANCVFECGGTLDKLLGDGLMAIFGVADRGDGAVAAIQAALRMREEMARLNEARGESIRFGVGIATGEVVLGAIGSARRSDYTAIGDAVNVASRMEAACKDFAVDCVIASRSAVLALPEIRLRRLGVAEVRGRVETIEVWTPA